MKSATMKNGGFDFAQLASATWQAVRPWAERNITFSLLLAVLTEVPRWTFAFRAVNEPLWAGIPLAILIAFAAAHAWEEYFAEHDWLLLALNVASLVFAVFTIAPVLYAMIDTEAHEVSIAQIFPMPLRWVWAVVLACTTFLPLIQLAVVEARRRERAQVDRMLVRVVPQKAKAQDLPAAQEPKQLPENSMDIAQQKTDASAMSLDDLRAWAQKLRDAGAKLEDIAAQVGKSTTWVSRNTESVAV